MTPTDPVPTNPPQSSPEPATAPQGEGIQQSPEPTAPDTPLDALLRRITKLAMGNEDVGEVMAVHDAVRALASPPAAAPAEPVAEQTLEQQLAPLIERLEKLHEENKDDVAYATARGHLHSARRWFEQRTARFANQANVERR